MKSFYATVIVLMGVAVVMFAAGQPAFADVTIANANFEATLIANLEPTWYLQPDSWIKTGDAGLSTSAASDGWPHDPLGFTTGNGVQCGFLEGLGALSQDVNGWATGTSYTLTFWASGAYGNYASLDWTVDPIRVTVGSTTVTFATVTSVTPANGGAWYTSDPFTVSTAGVNTLAFTALTGYANSPPYPLSTFDDVSVATVPEPSTLILLAFGLIGAAAYIRRRR